MKSYTTDFPNMVSEFFIQFPNRQKNALFMKKRKSKEVDRKS
jgi:hypothetical protein